MVCNKSHCYNSVNFDENIKKMLIDLLVSSPFTNRSITYYLTTDQASKAKSVGKESIIKIERERITNEDVKLIYEIYSKLPFLKKKYQKLNITTFLSLL